MTDSTTIANHQPPPAFPILMAYIALGSLLSFTAGREPGTLPENIPREMAPVVIVACGFLVSYSLWDVMAVGRAKAKTEYMCAHQKYKDLPPKIPEEVFLALRVQTNQVEQLPVFLAGSLSCALLVDGTVAGVLALAWAVLRRLYASTYRGAVGVPFAEMGLGKFTIPAYFVVNAMLVASAVHAVRSLVVS